jgi:hypothetical protein
VQDAPVIGQVRRPRASERGGGPLGSAIGPDMTDDRVREAGLGEPGQERAELAVRDVLDGDGERADRSYENNVGKRST